jgi:hypothetical protein
MLSRRRHVLGLNFENRARHRRTSGPAARAGEYFCGSWTPSSLSLPRPILCDASAVAGSFASNHSFVHMDYLIAVDRAKGPNKSAYMARVLNILSSRRKRLSEAGDSGRPSGTAIWDWSTSLSKSLINCSTGQYELTYLYFMDNILRGRGRDIVRPPLKRRRSTSGASDRKEGYRGKDCAWDRNIAHPSAVA